MCILCDLLEDGKDITEKHEEMNKALFAFEVDLKKAILKTVNDVSLIHKVPFKKRSFPDVIFNAMMVQASIKAAMTVEEDFKNTNDGEDFATFVGSIGGDLPPPVRKNKQEDIQEKAHNISVHIVKAKAAPKPDEIRLEAEALAEQLINDLETAMKGMYKK